VQDLLIPLLGNETVRARLWRAADENRLHHCYLFEGPEGIGKFHTAMQLALYCNCRVAEETQPGFSFFQPRTERPCGSCSACRTILAGSHPDILVIGPDPEKTTKVISTEQARNLISALQLQRHSAKRRFVIIDPADAMNEEAANALLKTLEEPPIGTQFILVTARAGALLQTVRSRSQRVRFGPVSEELLAGWLDEKKLDPRLAVLSQGSFGRSLMLSEGGTGQHKEVADAVCEVIGRPMYQLMQFTESLGKKAEGGTDKATLAVDILEELLRDTVLLANGRSSSILHTGRRMLLQRWAEVLYPQGVARLCTGISTARDRLRLNVNGRVVLEALLTQVAQELNAR
jgi:DNA polymerase-3 subunit delta'